MGESVAAFVGVLVTWGAFMGGLVWIIIRQWQDRR